MCAIDFVDFERVLYLKPACLATQICLITEYANLTEVASMHTKFSMNATFTISKIDAMAHQCDPDKLDH